VEPAFNRPGLDEALNYCRRGDTFVVWELDRLGRSLKPSQLNQGQLIIQWQRKNKGNAVIAN
jgi:DNA invertase Pin-like site-specific DNA recombinase